jgi:hypothetical protein
MLPGTTISQFFYVRTAAGNTIAADATPTCTLLLGAIATAVSVAVSASADGGWVAEATIPSHWTEGSVVHLRIAAMAGGFPTTQTIRLGEVTSPQVTAAAVWQNSDRTLTTSGNNAIAASVWGFIVSTISTVGSAARLLNRLAKIHGLTSANVSASDTGRTTSDGDVNQAITTNVDGSKTMSGDE